MKKFSSIMRGSSRRTSRNKRLIRIVWIGLIALVLLYAVPRVFSFTASLVMAPVVGFESWVRDSGDTIPSYFRDRDDLLAAQQDLERRLAEYSGSAHTVELLRVENLALKKLLGASSTMRIGAGVIGRPTEMPYDVMIIDKGTADGVQELAPVFVGYDQVIGFVATAHKRKSVVVLATTPGLESTVYIYGPNIYTTAVGVGGGSLKVSVPQGIALDEGNVVAMPSFDAGVYGIISIIDTIPTRPEQFGFVSIDVPLQSIRFVSVGTAPLEPISFEAAKEIVEKTRADLLTVPVPSGILVDIEEDTGVASSTNEEES